MTTENLLSALPSSLKPSPSTMLQLLSLKYGIRQAKKDISRLRRCTIETQIVQSSFTTSHKLYVTCGKPVKTPG